MKKALWLWLFLTALGCRSVQQPIHDPRPSDSLWPPPELRVDVRQDAVANRWPWVSANGFLVDCLRKVTTGAFSRLLVLNSASPLEARVRLLGSEVLGSRQTHPSVLLAQAATRPDVDSLSQGPAHPPPGNPVAEDAVDAVPPRLSEVQPSPAHNCTKPLEKPQWVSRSLSTGVMPGPHFMVQRSWALNGSHALMRVEEFRAEKSSPKPWVCESGATYEGSVRSVGRDRIFVMHSVANPDESFVEKCVIREVAVAPANDVRVPVAPEIYEEGCNPNKWTKPRSRVTAMVCGGSVYAGAPPGIEHVTTDEDDCRDPELALRRVPRDGSVMPVRSPNFAPKYGQVDAPPEQLRQTRP